MHIHLFLCIRLFRFFFSSRRRHTRCSRDWSSDVCSSDLKAGAHGELCGLLAIRSALEARGDMREVVLVPESADRKSTRLNSSHGYISYAVFCLKKKNNTQEEPEATSTSPRSVVCS